VLVASAGDEALLVSAQHTGVIHLLLTDVVMPRMSGKMLAHELVKTRPTTKVLYMSGYADNAFVHHHAVGEVTHFVSKPFTATDIAQKVRSVLDHPVDNASEGHEQAPKADAAVVNQHSLDRAALQALPEDILASLRKAVAAQRYDEIVAIVETIRITEPDVATRLRRMTDIFDYDGVQDLLGR
jgi:YesN/AraC family two-component response regulator